MPVEASTDSTGPPAPGNGAQIASATITPPTATGAVRAIRADCAMSHFIETIEFCVHREAAMTSAQATANHWTPSDPASSMPTAASSVKNNVCWTIVTWLTVAWRDFLVTPENARARRFGLMRRARQAARVKTGARNDCIWISRSAPRKPANAISIAASGTMKSARCQTVGEHRVRVDHLDTARAARAPD